MSKLEELTKEERKEFVKSFLKEMYFHRREKLFEWAKITRQTPLIETKFLGQNLVSLVTGISGKGTAARGDDLSDGSEVKTCSRIDQLSKCKGCGAYVTAYENYCSVCGREIKSRMTDSHWIFTINTENKYKNLTEKTPKIYFLLIDDEDLGRDKLARFSIWIINPRTNQFFKENYIKDYYEKYFLAKKRADKNPAPMNVHPKSPKFNKLKAELIFEAVISSDSEVTINKFLD